MKALVFGYKRVTESGRLIAKKMDGGYSYPGFDVHPEKGQVVINWGSGDGANWFRNHRVINDPEAICNSIYKNRTFTLLKRAGCKIPEFTSQPSEALAWIHKGATVFAREILDGRAGKGIRIFNGDPRRPEQVTLGQLGYYQMFTKKFDAKWEFKIHVAFGEAWLVWQVSKDPDYYAQSPHIRNYANGYHFKNEYRNLHPAILKDSVKACKALGLDFCVLDVGVGAGPGEWCIYESNTAPAIDENDARKYVKMFTENLRLK